MSSSPDSSCTTCATGWDLFVSSAGCCEETALVFSTHHPASDVQLSTSGDYFATELIHDRWTKGGKDFDVSFWRRPLTAMFAAIAEAGFRVDCLSEPAPLDECRERFPEAWERLSTQPHFLFFRLTPHR
jgi:hypothetical protein